MKKIFLALFILAFVACNDDETIPTCADPTNLLVQDLGTTTVTLTWNEVDTTDWKIEYGTAGFTQGTGTVVNITTDVITIENLQENTTYDAYLQATCANGAESNWVSFPAFTTQYDCLMPTNIEVTDVQNTTATLTWDAANFSEEVEVEYGTAGFIQGNGTVVSTTEDSITLENFIQNTTYDVYLRTKCDDGTFSQWTTAYTFTTTLTCNLMTGVQILNVAGTTTTLTWNFASFTEEVEIEYGTAGFTQGNGTVVSTTENSILLQNLTPNTTYDAYLRTKCVDGNFSIWSLVQTFTTTNCQGNYNGSITLLTQQDVDSFNYETITGGLYIGDINGAPSDIHDLSPLNCLSVVRLLRVENNPNLQTLNGLENLNVINFGAYIENNSSLLNIDALSNVISIGDSNDYWEDGRVIFIIENNASLTHINFPNLTSAKSTRIIDCPSLTSIEMPLTTFFFSLRIINNPQINNLNFQNLGLIGGVGLGGINFGGLTVYDTQLTNLNTFSNLTYSRAGFGIGNNPLLQDLNGLSNCVIGGNNPGLGIVNNDLLTDLSGINFDNNPPCVSIFIHDNDSLSDISTLSVLDCIRSLTIRNNDLLTNLDAFQNLSACLLGDVKIENNSALSNFCGPASFLSGLTPPECFLTISGNLYNPTQQDLMDGNCSQ